jgi:hypothetical protein
MARRTEDPRVTDLRRYRKARELQRRHPPPRPRRESLLGARPRAGLILALAVIALVAAWVLPMLLAAR